VTKCRAGKSVQKKGMASDTSRTPKLPETEISGRSVRQEGGKVIGLLRDEKYQLYVVHEEEGSGR